MIKQTEAFFVASWLIDEILFARNEQRASLVVDNGNGVSAESPGQLRQLNTDTGLYIGEYEPK